MKLCLLKSYNFFLICYKNFLVLAAVGASVLGGIEISSKKAQYTVTIGAALVLEVGTAIQIGIQIGIDFFNDSIFFLEMFVVLKKKRTMDERNGSFREIKNYRFLNTEERTQKI